MTKEPTTEVQKAVRFLLRGLRPEEIAVKLRVTVYTVYRWQRGATGKPHPGHIQNIRDLVRAERIRRKKSESLTAVA